MPIPTDDVFPIEIIALLDPLTIIEASSEEMSILELVPERFKLLA